DVLFTWRPDLIDGRRYVRVNFSNSFPPAPAPARKRSRFSVLIAAHKKSPHPLELYSERENTIRWFEAHHPEDLDLYGIGWDRYAFGGPRLVRALNRVTPLTRFLGANFPSYRGPLAAKRPALLEYRFSICYENARDIPGYITEKIFDSLIAGCVPVYWGAPDLAEHVPGACFVDRRVFRTHEELYAFLKGMSDADYEARASAIADYLVGRQWYPFSDRYFAETIAGVIARE
ncbi:MAG TPA: glycosyltransferase family 10, partial [Elusimicrobiales bacterium]|nr:glycosyltransferase family 10 [Elusimicrobiales bacterium]